MINNLLGSFGQTLSQIGYILIAILVLLVMITVHELGHYLTGKLFKFGIEEFSIGFGPKLISKKTKTGEVFSVRLIPLGGFCAFSGEDKESSSPQDFNNQKPWKRIIVLISGAIMNYLLALVLIAVMFGVYGQSALMTGKLVKDDNYVNSFYERDVILKADGKNVYMLTDLIAVTEGLKQGDDVEFTVLRDGEVKKIAVTMRVDTSYDNLEDVDRLYNALGISFEIDENGQMINPGMYTTGVKFGFFMTIARTFDYSFKVAGSIFAVLGQLLSGALGISSVGGTVTVLSVTANAIKVGGLRYLLNIASFIGVNLAVFNLLPIPALDGSRVVFTAIEWIRKKPVNRKVEAIIHTVGMILLLFFAVLVDILQLA